MTREVIFSKTAPGLMVGIIVKVEAGDAGLYECEMSNQLGSSLQTSVLTVQGGAPPSGTRATTGIIVIAVICCVLGTSLVWVLIIYHTRRRAARHWEMEGKRMQSTLTGLPLLGGDGDAGKEEPAEEENVSEKDSGTGDSKRSYDHDMEPNIVDHVIHNFLSARGEAALGELPQFACMGQMGPQWHTHAQTRAGKGE